jgi:hypothetical protein
VVVRAIGPSLADAEVANPLADPMLDLYDADGVIILSDDNWRDSQESLIQSTGLAPTNDAESAIIRSLTPGSYTAVVRGKDGGTGVALVEVYNLQSAINCRVADRPAPDSFRARIAQNRGYAAGGVALPFGVAAPSSER